MPENSGKGKYAAVLVPKLNKVFKYKCGGKYLFKHFGYFISKIDLMSNFGPNGDCWKYTGSKDRNGYGNMGIYKNGKTIHCLSHRISYEMFTGKLIPKGICVCHKCDNPSCVNPNHLFLGTVQDNMKDRDNKGRQADRCGENNSCAKLTWIQVKEIRRLYSTNKYTSLMLGVIYGVSSSVVYNIISNKIWVDQNYTRTVFDKHKKTGKFSDDEIRNIRKLHDTGLYTTRQLGNMFSLDHSGISRILNNKAYDWVSQ